MSAKVDTPWPWWSLARSWWENEYFCHIFRTQSPAEQKAPALPNTAESPTKVRELGAVSRSEKPLAVLVLTLTLRQAVQGKVSCNQVRNQYQWKTLSQAVGVKMPLVKSAFTDAPLYWKFPLSRARRCRIIFQYNHSSAVNKLTLACIHPFTVLVPLELLSCPPGFVTTNQCSFYWCGSFHCIKRYLLE